MRDFIIVVMPLLLCLVLFFPGSPPTTDACFIHGTDSGFCTEQTTDYRYRAAAMPFCGKYINYPACLPMEQKIPPSREWPKGRWFNHTTLTKDTWISTKAKSHHEYRRGLERNKTLYNMGINEWGEEKPIHRYRFWHRPDCKHAYFALFCWINFPRCDMNPARLLSLPTCRSACENYNIACGFDADLWRCGKPKWYNGDGPEESTNTDPNTGASLYKRDYFPGSPFRKNRFKKDGLTDRPICTPAMKGAASHVGGRPPMAVTLVLPVLSSLLLYAW